MNFRTKKQGARIRTAIVDEIAAEYVATQKKGRTLAFGDGLDVAARAIVNAIDDEKKREHLRYANEKLGFNLLADSLRFALDALSSHVQNRVELEHGFSDDPTDGPFVSQEQEEPEGFADSPELF